MFKKMLLVILGFAMPAVCLAWIPGMQFRVSPYQAQVQVMNPTGYTVFCQGAVFGQLQNGMVINSWFSSYVYPFGCQFAYVYATPPFYLVNAWANIQCQ